MWCAPDLQAMLPLCCTLFLLPGCLSKVGLTVQQQGHSETFTLLTAHRRMMLRTTAGMQANGCQQ